MTAHYNELIILFFSNKRFLAIAILYFIGISLVFTQVTHALFTDSVSSNENTFTAATAFPLTPPETTITGTPTITPTPTPANIASHLVISEIQTDAAGVGSQDFIELYNPTDDNIDLNGHRLVRRTQAGTSDSLIVAWSSSIVVPPHTFYLWATSYNSYAATISADISSNDNLANNNSIAIRQGANNTGLIIDALAWGTGHTATLSASITKPINPLSGTSLERKAYATSDASSMTGIHSNKGNGFDSDTDASDFISRTIPEPQNSSSPVETP